MKKIVMVDQDGVVCNEQYQATKNIKSFIRELAKEEIIIAPNSDTPVERLFDNFEKMLGLSSQVIIGEKGAVIRINKTDFFSKNIRGIDGYIKNLCQSVLSLDDKIEIVIGDSATWIREKKIFKPESKMIIIDGIRQQTIGFYLRSTDGIGVPIINEKWSKKALSIIRNITLPDGLEELDYNPKYGIAIGNVRGVDKTKGYIALKEMYPKAEFFMIGDSDNDIINDESVKHCAVSNATENLKKRVAFISDFSITEGLEDCLKWVIAH